MSATLEQPLDLVATNAVLETYDPPQVVAWAVKEFGTDLVMSSSFGAESALLIHMATQVMPDIRIITVDTGYLFPETHEFMEDLQHRFHLNLWRYHTKNDPIAYLKEAGETEATVRIDRDRCCEVNKNEPFDRAMQKHQPKAWLRGIRRDQSTTRQDRKIVEWSKRFSLYAVSPLLNWSSREIYRYMKQHDLPFHPLYEKGYASIGCNPTSCTRAITIGEDPRAGRWAGTDKIECGLHLEEEGGSGI